MCAYVTIGKNHARKIKGEATLEDNGLVPPKEKEDGKTGEGLDNVKDKVEAEVTVPWKTQISGMFLNKTANTYVEVARMTQEGDMAVHDIVSDDVAVPLKEQMWAKRNLADHESLIRASWGPTASVVIEKQGVYVCVSKHAPRRVRSMAAADARCIYRDVPRKYTTGSICIFGNVPSRAAADYP